MNNKAKGEISEAQIIARLVKLGINVSIPFGNNQRYDLIIEVDNKLLKVQCKTARLDKSGTLQFKVASYNGEYPERKTYHNQIDIFLVYYPGNDSVYCIPIAESTTTTMSLKLNPGKINHPSIRYADDYLLEKWLKSLPS